jgi:hypothetical protein
MIWNLKIPNAVKMFMWRACHDLLPTKQNLLLQGVISDDLCPFCLQEVETVKYILWSCPSTQDVWRCGPKKLKKKCTAGGLTFTHIFEELIGCCEIMELELIAVMARKIWFWRNIVIHGVEFIHPQHITREASLSLDEFREATKSNSNTQSTSLGEISILWYLLPPGTYKVN